MTARTRHTLNEGCSERAPTTSAVNALRLRPLSLEGWQGLCCCAHVVFFGFLSPVSSHACLPSPVSWLPQPSVCPRPDQAHCPTGEEGEAGPERSDFERDSRGTVSPAAKGRAREGAGPEEEVVPGLTFLGEVAGLHPGVRGHEREGGVGDCQQPKVSFQPRALPWHGKNVSSYCLRLWFLIYILQVSESRGNCFQRSLRG